MSEGVSRVYLMGYEPPGWDMQALADDGTLKRIMQDCDQRVIEGDGKPWSLGYVLPISVPSEGLMAVGESYQCVGHDCDGLVALVVRVGALA